MAKTFQLMAVGLAATLFTSLVGCSQGSQPDTSSADVPAEQSAVVADEEVTADTSDVDVADDTDLAETGDYRVVENITPPEPSSDPMAMAFALRPSDQENAGSEQIKVTYPAPDRAVVVRVARGLQDDSVKAIRTRYEFQSTDGGQSWQLSQVGEQIKCQSGRGSEEWSAELCQ